MTAEVRLGPIVLVLPAFNEAASVAAVIAEVPASVGGHDVVCVVVDDGSSDDTAAVASAAGGQVVCHDQNRGLGAAVRTGLNAALTYEPVAIAFCDADGEYSPQELVRLVHPILEGVADYVVGSRFAGEAREMRGHRWVGNKLLTVALSVALRRRVTDGQSGYRALSPEAAAAAEIAHDYNYAQVLTVELLRKGFRYHEVPISYRFRTSGTSFIKLRPYLCHVVPAVWRELRRPPNGEGFAPPAAAIRGAAAPGSSPLRSG